MKSQKGIEKELLDTINKLRVNERLTQKELERLSGVRQPMLARIEHGYTRPRIDTMLKILKPLGKTLKIVDIN